MCYQQKFDQMISLNLLKYGRSLGLFCLASSILINRFFNETSEMDFQIGMLMGLSIPLIALNLFYVNKKGKAKRIKNPILIKNQPAQPRPNSIAGSFPDKHKNSNHPHV